MQEYARELSAKYGATITAYNDLDEMLANPDIHVVSVCSYPYDHAMQVIAAARAGKHQIIEKPLCLSLKDLRAMQKAVQQARIKTCVCFECRYSSQFLATKAVIDQGLLGKAPLPVRLTKKSNVDVEELAFFHVAEVPDEF